MKKKTNTKSAAKNAFQCDDCGMASSKLQECCGKPMKKQRK